MNLSKVGIFAVGCPDNSLPEPLLGHEYVNCLTSNGKDEPYKDHLCLFRALTIHLHGATQLEETTKDLFLDFISRAGYDVAQFRGVSFPDLHLVEDVVQHNVFIYDIDIEDGSFVGELARRSMCKYDKTIKLLRYNHHILHVPDVNKFFKSFRCLTCDSFFSKANHLNRHAASCKDRVKNIYPRSVYTLRETLFDKLDSFNIPYTDDQKLFKNLAVFDFESICIQNQDLTDTISTTWIGKHVPISVSISSNLFEEPFFICSKDPKDLIISFVTKLELIADKSKAEMRMKFESVENAIKSKLNVLFEKLGNRRTKKYRSFEYEDECVEDDEENVSTQFLQQQKNQMVELLENYERYVNTLPVFGFNSGKYDLNLIKEYLIPYLINDRDIQPTVIKKSNQFVSFKFGNIQFLDILSFLGGATSLDSFLKAYGASETKGFFPYEWFDQPDKLDSLVLPSYDDFFSKLKNCNPLDKDAADYKKLLDSGLNRERALKKLKLKDVPLTGEENYKYLQSVWTNKAMKTFRDFLCWYNNKDVVPTLEAMQKMMEFYHNKGIDMLKLGCTLPNLANICLHNSTNHIFYPFCGTDKDLLEKIREDMTGGPSIVFTRKAVVNETFIRKSKNVCKAIVGIDASQLYPFSMCQPMPTGLYTRWEFNTEKKRFVPSQGKSRKFENMVMAYVQATHPECKIESFITTGKQKKIDSYAVDGYCDHCKTVYEAMGCYFHYHSCKEGSALLDDDEVKRGQKKRELDELRKNYIEEKGYKVVQIWECEWWTKVKNDPTTKQFIRTNFPYKLPLTHDNLLNQIRTGSLFGYVQCDLEVPDELKSKFADFPPIFKNTEVSRNDIGEFMKNYASENKLLTQPQRMLISSFQLTNGTVITPLLNFYLSLGLRCTKIHRFVQYTPQKCFNSFVQSVVDARRGGDLNPQSGVVAETMKLLGNSSYGYQIMDRSRHTETKYLSEEKTHQAINNKMFKRLSQVVDNVYEVELVKSKIEHKEPIIVGFFILQYAKLRMLELYYNFFDKFCDKNKYEELEMDTDSLYLALAEENLEDCIRRDMLDEWKNLRRNDCNDQFKADSTGNFFPRNCCDKHIKHDKREPGLFKEEFRCTEMYCLCSKTYCCYDSKTDIFKFSSKGLNKRTLEESGEGPLEKYRRVMDDNVNVKSTNRGFRTVNHKVVTYEQTKKGLSYFYPKRIVEADGIHTRPLTL